MAKKRDIFGILSQFETAAPAGFAVALHIEYTTPRFLFQTYNQKWMEVYSSLGLVMKDPTVIWGFSNTGIVDWAELEDQDHAGVLALARDYGLAHGFTCALTRDDSRSIASFAHESRRFREQEKSALSAALQDLHEMTAAIDSLSAEQERQLKLLSIAFTRGQEPGSTGSRA